MAPTLVFERSADGSLGPLLLSGGSPGGPFIIHFVAKSLYATLNWGLDAQQAIDLPNFGSMGGPVLLEQGRFPAATVEALKSHGHRVQELDITSGVQLIQKTPSGFFGGADPRREGVVRGD
jgi:gamma-glutamyltranspeptidase/glutathione hydrolase